MAEVDRTVQRLGIAMEGRIIHAVALQYRDLVDVMLEIADLLLRQTPDTRRQHRPPRAKYRDLREAGATPVLGLHLSFARNEPRRVLDRIGVVRPGSRALRSAPVICCADGPRQSGGSSRSPPG